MTQNGSAHSRPPVPSASASSKRENLGEWISGPVLRFVPAWVHPNHITYLNHVFAWALLICSLSAYSLPGPYSMPIALVVCSGLNFTCMVLDCLDGMQARKTKQCSKLGELLDHWLDAAHAPMISSGLTFALQLPFGMLLAANFLTCAVYGAELVDYHYNRVFVATQGVEAQLVVSLYYLLAIVMNYLEPHHALLLRQACASFAIVWSCHLTWKFARKFDSHMNKKFVVLLMYLGAPAVLCWFGALTLIEFLLVMPFVSFRITGSYVLFSILRHHYVGYCTALMGWFGLIAWTHWAMDPLPISVFYHHLIPYIGNPFPHITLQQVLPFLLMIDTAIRNVRDVRFHLPRLK